MKLELLIYFTKQDLIDRYSGSLLGGMWSFIMPLVNICVFILIFSKIMGAKLENFGAEFAGYGYSLYLISGILAWNAFANTLIRTTNIYKDKKNIIGKINIPLKQLPLYIIASETIVYLISLTFFLIFILLIGYPVTWHWLLIFPIYILQTILAYALGFSFATISVFIRDVRELVSVMTQLWFWFSPIIYIITILPESIKNYFQLNPIYHLMNAYREVILYHQIPDQKELAIILLISLIFLTISQRIYKALEKDIRDFI